MKFQLFCCLLTALFIGRVEAVSNETLRYAAFSGSFTFQQAQDFCHNKTQNGAQGKLATARSDTENSATIAALTGVTNTPNFFWMGLKSQYVGGPYRWTDDNSLLTITQFPPDPEGDSIGYYDCVGMNADSLLWHDANCSQFSGALCEFNPDFVASPVVFKQYELITRGYNWSEAKAVCESETSFGFIGQLATVRTFADLDAIRVGYPLSTGDYYHGWLGGVRKYPGTGPLVWLPDEAAVSKLGFAGGEPDEGDGSFDEDCLALSANNLQLYDLNCGIRYFHAVCEFNRTVDNSTDPFRVYTQEDNDDWNFTSAKTRCDRDTFLGYQGRLGTFRDDDEKAVVQRIVSNYATLSGNSDFLVLLGAAVNGTTFAWLPDMQQVDSAPTPTDAQSVLVMNGAGVVKSYDQGGPILYASVLCEYRPSDYKPPTIAPAPLPVGKIVGGVIGGLVGLLVLGLALRSSDRSKMSGAPPKQSPLKSQLKVTDHHEFADKSEFAHKPKAKPEVVVDIPPMSGSLIPETTTIPMAGSLIPETTTIPMAEEIAVEPATRAQTLMAEEVAVEPVPKAPTLMAGKKYHLFISHNWGLESANHARVAKLAMDLETHSGLRVWFDSNRLYGNVLGQVTQGLDDSVCFAACITRDYMEKIQSSSKMARNDWCEIEFDGAFRRMGKANMLAIVCEKECLDQSKWVGPVHTVLGGSLFVDFTDDSKLKNAGQGILFMVTQRMSLV